MRMRFFAAGNPMPQGSKTPGQTKDGRLYVRENGGERHKAWREAVRRAAVEAAQKPAYGVGEPAVWETVQGAVAVDVLFLFEARKGVKDAEGAVKISSPDLDKLVRSVLDSLTDAAVWADDARVVDLQARKRYTTDPGKVGAIITVATI